jgi:hypothetical protein
MPTASEWTLPTVVHMTLKAEATAPTNDRAILRPMTKAAASGRATETGNRARAELLAAIERMHRTDPFWFGTLRRYAAVVERKAGERDR